MRENKEYRIWKRVLSVLMAAVIVAAIANPLTVQAKTKTVKPKAANNVQYEALAKKASKRVYTGTSKVYLKQYMALSYGGYVKFVAPKTKTYSFTVSNLKHPAKGGTLMGGVSFYYPNEYGHLMNLYVRTKGGVSNSLEVANPKPKGLYYANATQVYYTSRTGKVKLYKGDVVYLGINMVTHKFSKKSMNLTLKIK